MEKSLTLSQEVYHKNLGKGTITAISPSKSLVEVYFNSHGKEVVLSSSLTISKTNQQ